MSVRKSKHTQRLILNKKRSMRLSALEWRGRPSTPQRLGYILSSESGGPTETEKSYLLQSSLNEKGNSRQSSSDKKHNSQPSHRHEEETDDESSFSAPLLAPFDDAPTKGCPCIPHFNRGRKAHKVRAAESSRASRASQKGDSPKQVPYCSLDRSSFQELPPELKTILIARDKHFQSENKKSASRLATDANRADSEREPICLDAYGASVIFCRSWERKDSNDDQCSSAASSNNALSTLYEEDEETDMSESTAPKEKVKNLLQDKPEKLLEYLRRDADACSEYSGLSPASSLVLSIPDDLEEVWAEMAEDAVRVHQDTRRPSQKVDNVLASLWSKANNHPKPEETKAPKEAKIPEDIVIIDEPQDLLQLESSYTNDSAIGIFDDDESDEEKVKQPMPAPESPIDLTLLEPEAHLEMQPPIPDDAACRSFYPVLKTDSDSVKETDSIQDQALLYRHREPTQPATKQTVLDQPALLWIVNLTKRSFRALGGAPKHQPKNNEQLPTSPQADTKALTKSYKGLSDDKDELWYYKPIKSYPSVDDLPQNMWDDGDWRLTVELESIEVEALALARIDSTGSCTALLMYNSAE